MRPAAVAGVRRAIKELVDGTIRVQIDIDPKDKRDFLELFGEIDMPVALAPLTPDYRERQKEKSAALGPLAQSAVVLCRERAFQRFVAHKTGAKDCDEDGAAAYLKAACNVQSRKDLDVVDGARTQLVCLMAEYREWQDKHRMA